MQDKPIPYRKIADAVLIVLALCYLVYRLVSFEDYASFLSHFRSCTVREYVLLVLALLLFPINMLLEGVKWQYLLRGLEPVSLHEAQRQVYYGCVGAFVTPNRLGEFPTRALLLRNKDNYLEAVTLGFAGGFAMVCTIEVIGVAAVAYFFLHLPENNLHRTVVFSVYVLLLLTIVLLVVFFPRIQKVCSVRLHGKIRSILDAVVGIGYKRFGYLCVLSLFRYIIFSVQLYCIFYFCGIHLTLYQSFISIPTYYALVSIMPSIPVADTVFRGSWALIVFSFFTENVAAIATTVLIIWFINTVLPMLVGLCVQIRGAYVG